MYGYESWTVKKAEHQRIDASELWCWRRLLRVSEHSYLNAEAKFMFAHDDNVVIMLGYGYKF